MGTEYAQHPDLVGKRVLVTGGSTIIPAVQSVLKPDRQRTGSLGTVFDMWRYGARPSLRLVCRRKLIRHWQSRRLSFRNPGLCRQQVSNQNMRYVEIENKASSGR